MGYDGSGNFSRAYNFTTDKTNGILIQSTRMDGEFDNYATAMNQVLLRNGVAALTGDFKVGGNKLTGIGGGSVGSPSVQSSVDTTTGIYFPAAGALGFACGGVDRLRLNASGGYLAGSFGLGTVTAPRTVLDVGGISSFKGCFEDCTLTATAATGTMQLDYITNALTILDANAAANWTFNIRGNSTTSLDSIMAVNQVLTLCVEVPQGATPYYCTAITVDGGAPSQIKWFSGAPTAGNASGIDVYSITVIKKAAATFYVRASQNQVK